MPTVTNKRRTGDIICEGVHLKPGPNEITDEAAAKLQKSAAYKRHTQRGWLGGLPRLGATPAPSAAVPPATNPAQSDGSPPDASTKPEEAAQDFPEALDRSKSKAPGVKR